MQRIEPMAWHASVAAAIADGHDAFVTLMAIDDDGLQVWLRLRSSSVDTPVDAVRDDVVLAVDASAGVATITDLLPAAAWYEREAAEMFGVAFHGHATAPLLLPAGAPPPMLRDHWLEARQVPWPGAHEPGATTSRRRQQPPGVRP